MLWFGAAAALGLALSLLFVVGITGMDRLVGQTEMRTDGGVTFRELFLRQGRYYLTLLPRVVPDPAAGRVRGGP